MQSVLFERKFDDSELIADLWECGTTGIIEEDRGLRAFFEETVDVSELARRYHALEIRREDPPDLTHFSHEGWDPIFVGSKFFIAPSWVTAETPTGRFRLNIDATTAFGTGRHESTQLMLETLEEVIRPGHVVLDVGCGSGILSVAALLLGADRVLACDIHEDAIASAAGHVKTSVFAGSADAVRDRAADIVLVNISARVIDVLAFDLKRVTKPDGLIIAAGFICGDTPKRLKPVRSREQGEWLCWVCRPEDVLASSEMSPQPHRHSQRWW